MVCLNFQNNSLSLSTENCQWDDWGPWQWNDQVEVDGEMTKCGNGMRTRGKKKPAKHGGLNCTGPREETDVKPCPLGMNIIQNISCTNYNVFWN